ncbi:NUDIX hydrolase [Ottowia thiooxydans]|uniref:NUDIX hydrolase n=1 Tax=Ottowia thiooxydans TaxID=219182 RepID=UPI00048AC571|nr:NUDIX domain-containing protein [Ottowia thiooxydans]
MELNSNVIDTPPRDAASLVMIRDGAQGLEVLLVRRHTDSSVLGGACVFPGGKLDAADSSADLLARLDRAPSELHARLGEPELSPTHAAALYVAAAREAFEEAGVLYQQVGNTEIATVDATARASLNAGESFGTLLARLGLTLDTDALVPWSRWITPRRPSVMNKRFDTRFFLAVAPTDQTARHDNFETTETLWLTPRSALTEYKAGSIDLAPPQIMGLAHLAGFTTVAQARADALTRKPPLVEPESFEEDGTRVLCYPGDERHSVRERALPTPTRLVWKDKRFEPPGGFEAFFQSEN